MISIAGDLGSGKSTIAKRLAEKLGYTYFSTGMLFRKLAAERGMDALQLNYLSETDLSIDKYIDDNLRAINNGNDTRYILDSRMAWHFVPKSFKIYATVRPEVAAQRVSADKVRLGEPETTDLQQCAVNLLERQNVENRRYKTLYGVNCDDLSNYDLIIDTSNYTVDELVEQILSSYKHSYIQNS
ncbi:MAG: (d)CMP kinase [Bacteroidales bacterium]|jgi:cytidylate kinase|nr:(d)CMP kinase [Bacteroidales bacterium]